MPNMHLLKNGYLGLAEIGAYKQICFYKLLIRTYELCRSYGIYTCTHTHVYCYSNTLHKRITLSESVQVVTIYHHRDICMYSETVVYSHAITRCVMEIVLALIFPIVSTCNKAALSAYHTVAMCLLFRPEAPISLLFRLRAAVGFSVRVVTFFVVVVTEPLPTLPKVAGFFTNCFTFVGVQLNMSLHTVTLYRSCIQTYYLYLSACACIFLSCCGWLFVSVHPCTAFTLP